MSKYSFKKIEKEPVLQDKGEVRLSLSDYNGLMDNRYKIEAIERVLFQKSKSGYFYLDDYKEILDIMGIEVNEIPETPVEETTTEA